MSFGLMSAMRLTPLSWLEEFEPAADDAARIAFVPGWMTSFETMTPSTTYSGSDAALIDVTPRRRTCMPPPGAPEFA